MTTNKIQFKINHAAYFGVLAAAFGAWIVAAANNPPPYTKFFFLFIIMIYFTEYYNVFWKNLQRHGVRNGNWTVGNLKINLKLSYKIIKFSQRFLTVLTIILLSDGDVVELSVGGLLAIVLLAARVQLGYARQDTWDWLERIDEVILGYLIVFLVHAANQYGFGLLTTPRLMLLLGFAIHFAIVVYR